MANHYSGKVYLAGPIAGRTYDAANGWRLEVAKTLQSYGVTALNPLRGKEFLRSVGAIPISVIELHPFSTDEGITTRDRYDVMQCNLLLANFLGATKASVGTAIEFGWADAFRKPIIMVIEKEGNPFDHPMPRHLASYRVERVEDAVSLALALLIE